MIEGVMSEYTIHPMKSDDPDEIEPMYAILAGDDTTGFVVGEMAQVKQLYAELGRLVKSGQHSGEIDEMDERLGWVWLNTDDAFRLATEHGYEVSPITIRWACRKGYIRKAIKRGRDWSMNRARFLGWLKMGPHKPGPRGKAAQATED